MQEIPPDHDALPSFRRTVALIGLAAVVLLLAGSIGVSAWMKRAHLQAQLAEVSQDAATSLGFALSFNRDFDPVLADTMVDAMFNGGTYDLIELTDVRGQPVITRQARPDVTVPDWFRSWLPLKVTEGRADVMQGWTRLGSVRVRASLEAAYLELWRTLVHYTGWFFLVSTLVVIIMGILLSRLMAPLVRMEAVALQLAEGDLNVTWPAARYRELARVRAALATMSHKLRDMFREQLDRIEALRAEVMQDGLTQLPNRRAFLAQLRLALESDEEARSGVLVMIRYDDFAQFNREEGHTQGDLLLAQMGDVLRDALTGRAGAFGGRLKAAEFALFIAGAQPGELEGAWMAGLLDRLCLCPALQGRTAPRIGAGLLEVVPGDRVGEVMAVVDQALDRTLAGTAPRKWVVAERAAPGAQPTTISDWREEVEQALADQRVELRYQPVLSGGGAHVLYHQVTTCLNLEHGEWPAAQFLPLASRFGLLDRLDRHVLAQALAKLNEDESLRLAVPLSVQTLQAADFADWLGRCLKEWPGVGKRLILDVPEAAVLHAWAAVEALVHARSQLGFALAVSHFGGAGQPFGYVQRWRPDWLKLDGALCLRTYEEADNRFYMEALIRAAHSQDAKVVAILVETPEQAKIWRELGVDAVMGYHLARPQPAPVHLG